MILRSRDSSRVLLREEYRVEGVRGEGSDLATDGLEGDPMKQVRVPIPRKAIQEAGKLEVVLWERALLNVGSCKEAYTLVASSLDDLLRLLGNR